MSSLSIYNYAEELIVNYPANIVENKKG